MTNPSKTQGEPKPEPTANGSPNRSPNQSERFAEQWRTVQEIAELEGLSERAIQKRCQRGHYTARRIEGDKGDVWEIAAASNGAPIGRSANAESSANGSANRSPNNDEPTANRSPNEGELDAEPFAEPTANDAAPLDHAPPHEVEMLRAQLESARAETERERELSAFLKLQIEEGNRNAGELRAALREALRAMPKQLGLGTPGILEVTPQNATERSQSGAVLQTLPVPKSASAREPRPLWKVMLGMR